MLNIQTAAQQIEEITRATDDNIVAAVIRMNSFTSWPHLRNRKENILYDFKFVAIYIYCGASDGPRSYVTPYQSK